MLLFIVPKMVSFAASLILTPVHSIQTWFVVSSDSFPRFLRDRSELIDELNTLKSTQSARSGDRLTAQLLTNENNELRSLLGDGGEERILAGVIGRPSVMPYDVLVLDRGSSEGIVEGAPVFIGDNAIIGMVTKVFPNSSIVELVTTPGFMVSVYIMGPNIYTNAEGVGGGQLRVGVPQGISLSEGDLVILPGADSGVYGSISVVESTPTRPEQYGYVSPEVPLAGLRLVSVGNNPLKSVTFEEAQEAVAHVTETVFVVDIPDHILVTTENGSSTASSTATSTKKIPAE